MVGKECKTEKSIERKGKTRGTWERWVGTRPMRGKGKGVAKKKDWKGLEHLEQGREKERGGKRGKAGMGKDVNESFKGATEKGGVQLEGRGTRLGNREHAEQEREKENEWYK